MNKDSLEHLSSLIDGEINKDTGRFLIRRLGSDPEMRATWSRYHLVRDCLRERDSSTAGPDFCAGVREALEREETVQAKPAMAARWLKPVAGMAVAASVALMAIITVGPGPGATPDPAGDGLADTQLESFVSPNSTSARAPVSRQAAISNVNSNRQRINPYYLRHIQVSGATGGKGFVTMVPILAKPSSDSSDQGEPLNDEQPGNRDGEQTRR